MCCQAVLLPLHRARQQEAAEASAEAGSAEEVASPRVRGDVDVMRRRHAQLAEQARLLCCLFNVCCVVLGFKSCA